jgi:hypothetical protein
VVLRGWLINPSSQLFTVIFYQEVVFSAEFTKTVFTVVSPAIPGIEYRYLFVIAELSPIVFMSVLLREGNDIAPLAYITIRLCNPIESL